MSMSMPTSSTAQKDQIGTLLQWDLCWRANKAPVAWIKDGVFLGWHLSVRLHFLGVRSVQINIVMHLHQKTRDGWSKPPFAAKLEPAQMTAPIRRAEDGIRILLDFFIGNCLDMGYLRDC